MSKRVDFHLLANIYGLTLKKPILRATGNSSVSLKCFPALSTVDQEC